jgi:alpha-glucosidase
MARQSANGDWLIGAATNESARALNIPLSFIDKGAYDALVIEDGRDADYQTNKNSFSSSRIHVKQSDNIKLQLAPGGGACVLLQKKK